MPKVFNRTDTKTAKKTLVIYWNEMRQNKKVFLQYTALIIVNRLIYMVLLPLVFSFIIQSLILHPTDWQHPVWLLLLALALSGLSLFTSHRGYALLFRHEEAMRTSLTKTAIEALMRHSDQFFANRKTGTLAGDVNTFSGSLVSFLDIIYLQTSNLFVNFFASLVIIAVMSPVLVVPLALVTGLLIWRSIVSSSKRGPIRHKRKLLTSQLNGTIADILGNQQIVRYFAARPREIDRIVTDRQAVEQLANYETKVTLSENTLRQGTLFLFQIITMAVCVWLFLHASVSIAALVFAVTYLGRLTSSLFDITAMIRNTEQAFLDAANITDIMDELPEVVNKPHAPALVVSEGSVVFHKVSFSYKDNRGSHVLRDISLSIKPGERVGLAGHSGGGKTTFTKLVLRFANLDKGTITIDGQDIAAVSQESLRSQIAYVPQEPYLFHRSLRDNIAYGRPDASDDEILAAIKRANAEEFIDALPKGLDTIVGERGVKLSGGQRQRIALARAILKNAPILVLDEATSALDSESERLIQDALEKLMKGRTAIVVAHRLSTIAHLDRIVVLDKGAIVENGTHKALLKQKGIYASLWKHQSGGFLEE